MNLKPEQHKLLTLLLIADLGFLALHLLYRHTQLLPSVDFSLGRDRGYAEFYQYLKELWIALLFLPLAFRSGRVIYTVFALLFAYFLIDDSFELHENMGMFLADWFDLPGVAGLRPVDLGELAVYAYFALLFTIAIGLAYYRADPLARGRARTVILLVAGLASFGVLIDMLAIIAEPPWLAELLATTEEFGEMLVMSGITAYVFGFEPDPPVTREARHGDVGTSADS